MREKYKRFCEEYLVDLIGNQAAIRAGYSKRTANSQASRLLARDDIQEYIKKLRGKQTKRTDITADRVINEMAKIAFVKVDDFYNQDGSVKQLDELSDSAKASVSSYYVKRVKLSDDNYVDVPVFSAHNKDKQLENLAKHLGIFEKDNNQKSTTIKVEQRTLNDFYQ